MSRWTATTDDRPYPRSVATDVGMTSDEAERLAMIVREVHPSGVTVERDGPGFAVQVETETGHWTLYDEVDWESWQSRIVRG